MTPHESLRSAGESAPVAASPAGRRRVPMLKSVLAPVALAALAVGLVACGTQTAGGSGAKNTGSKGRPSSSTSSSSTTTTIPVALRPLPQPTAARPMTILEVGDSLGEDLGIGMGTVFANNPLVKVIQASHGDSGLARPDFYNWPSVLGTELQRYHPAAVVVLIGGNDGQSFNYGNGVVSWGSAQWHTVYSQRVATFMEAALKAHVKVLWVGLPIMQDPSFWREMATQNAIYKAEAASHPGVTYFDSAHVFENSAGQYADTLPVNGQAELVRDSDGVHITINYGADLIAESIIPVMEHAWGINLVPPANAGGSAGSGTGNTGSGG